MTEWQHFFNEHAPVYDENCFTKNTIAEVDFLVDVLGLRPGMSILDIGCGTGRHSIELAARGYRMTGLDLSTGMLDQARRKAEAAGVLVEWIQADATDFSFMERFDRVICLCEGSFGLIESQDDPIRHPLAILQNAAQALKPGGSCLFTVLNGIAMVRRYTQPDVEQHLFDPISLSEHSDVAPLTDAAMISLRERGFVPTELRLMFEVAGLTVRHIWGGTAGNWGKRMLDLDEIEIMVVAEKAAGE